MNFSQTSLFHLYNIQLRLYSIQGYMNRIWKSVATNIICGTLLFVHCTFVATNLICRTLTSQYEGVWMSWSDQFWLQVLFWPQREFWSYGIETIPHVWEEDECHELCKCWVRCLFICIQKPLFWIRYENWLKKNWEILVWKLCNLDRPGVRQGNVFSCVTGELFCAGEFTRRERVLTAAGWYFLSNNLHFFSAFFWITIFSANILRLCWESQHKVILVY